MAFLHIFLKPPLAGAVPDSTFRIRIIPPIAFERFRSHQGTFSS